MLEYTRTDERVLELFKVSLSFGSTHVLRDVNAIVTDVERPNMDQGQVICFLGPSGIGKTQLSRIIAGLQVPSSGSVILKGGRATKPGLVCMVPQHYPMFDYTTVAGNLAIAGKMAGLSKSESNAKAQGYIDAFDLAGHLNKYPRDLSGGTRQRVAIARQLMCATNYMVMDEPFSGLDPIMKKRTTAAIVKLSRLNTYNTIIIVTHDIMEGLSVADTVWLMGKETGQVGATLVDQVDLAKAGFAWREDLHTDQSFLTFVETIKERFQTLKG